MFKPRFSDTTTHDTMFKKVFFRHSAAFAWLWFAVTAPLLYIIYIYCHKCHKCHCPLFSGVSSVTLVFALVSCVIGFSYAFPSVLFVLFRSSPQ